MKKIYGNYEINGYRWFGFFDGYHHFSKVLENGYGYVVLLDEDMHNGNAEYMLAHDLTRKFKKNRYEKN